MAGLLDTDFIRDIFGAAFEDIYGDGELIRVDMVRQESGTITPQLSAAVPIKVQVDICTEAMRAQAGYSDTDVRLLILQSGIAGRDLNNDDMVRAKDRAGVLRTWKVFGVTQDPARSYWEARGIRKGDNT